MTTRRNRQWVGLGLAALLAAPAFPGPAAPPGGARDTIHQTAPIDALLAGVYDGKVSLGALLRHGDTGIGTLQGLDGELVILDGKAFQVRGDGSVRAVANDALTPFAVVTWMENDQAVGPLDVASLDKLTALLDRALPSSNRFYAVRAHGTFARVRTRSVPRQEKPYRPLAEVAREQAVFDLRDVTGTLVGFRCPAFVRGVNVPGYHLHFLSDDRACGGHVLDVRAQGLTVHLDDSDALFLALPRDNAFDSADLAADREEELRCVEGPDR